MSRLRFRKNERIDWEKLNRLSRYSFDQFTPEFAIQEPPLIGLLSNGLNGKYDWVGQFWNGSSWESTTQEGSAIELNGHDELNGKRVFIHKISDELGYFTFNRRNIPTPIGTISSRNCYCPTPPFESLYPDTLYLTCLYGTFPLNYYESLNQNSVLTGWWSDLVSIGYTCQLPAINAQTNESLPCPGRFCFRPNDPLFPCYLAWETRGSSAIGPDCSTNCYSYLLSNNWTLDSGLSGSNFQTVQFNNVMEVSDDCFDIYIKRSIATSSNVAINSLIASCPSFYPFAFGDEAIITS